MPSDKSGGVVIINMQDYIIAAEGILDDDSTYKLRRYPLTYMIDAYNHRLKAIIDSIPEDQGNGSLLQSIHKNPDQGASYTTWDMPTFGRRSINYLRLCNIDLSSSLITPQAKWVAGILSLFVGTF